jgi:predicted nucleotidyltransferase
MNTGAETSELAGTKEAAELFGVRTENFLRDWAKRPDFPAPIAVLAATPVWRRDDLERYRKARQPVPWPHRRTDLPLSPDAARWLPEIKRRLVASFAPDRIVLFGSQVRGDAGPESDIDLLVVMPSVDSVRTVTAEMQARLRGIPMSVDLTVTTPDRVERYGTLVGTILRPALLEGATLYARR